MSLNRMAKGLFVLGVIFILTGIMYLTVMPEPSIDELTWYVQVGDEFTYSIDVTGWNYSVDHYLPLSAVVLNQTQITFTITWLPPLSTEIETDSLTIIMEEEKTEPYLENEPLVKPAVVHLLVDAFSSCLLPVGNWPLIDQLYDDEFQGVYDIQGDYYLSRFDSQFFYISYLSYTYHGNYGWDGRLNLVTGVPTIIVVSDHIYEAFYQYEQVITLTLV